MRLSGLSNRVLCTGRWEVSHGRGHPVRELRGCGWFGCVRARLIFCHRDSSSLGRKYRQGGALHRWISPQCILHLEHVGWDSRRSVFGWVTASDVQHHHRCICGVYNLNGSIVSGTILATLLDGEAFEIIMGRLETTGFLRLSLRESFATDDEEQPLTINNFYYDATYGADVWETVLPDGQEIIPGHVEIRLTVLAPPR